MTMANAVSELPQQSWNQVARSFQPFPPPPPQPNSLPKKAGEMSHKSAALFCMNLSGPCMLPSDLKLQHLAVVHQH